MTQWGLDTLFNPAKRHMDEEKRRLQSTREEVGDSSGGRRIDLESGKVSIPKPSAEDEDQNDRDDDQQPAAKDAKAPAAEKASSAEKTSSAKKPPAAEKTSSAKKPPADESPARARARARRARGARG